MREGIFAPPGSWAERAECRKYPFGTMDLGYKVQRARKHSGDSPKEAYARAICDACPVRDECSAWALGEHDPAQGQMAGGLTPDERRLIRRRQMT